MSVATAAWIPVLPLAGFAFAGLLGRRVGRAAVTAVCCGVMVVAFVLAVGQFLGRGALPTEGARIELWSWIVAGGVDVQAAFLVDPLSLVMLLVVTGVGTLIHIYASSYMPHDPGSSRFFAYLNLFVFFMLILVLAESLPLMFVGWEGVGLCSYLLIGFWHDRPAAADAGLKAFLVNRVGDFGFMVAMLVGFVLFGTLSFPEMVVLGPGVLHQYGAAPLTLLTLMLLLAATGKSAQIPLYVWLPDAMEGPTPVSALIHAATMVTSGIYMIARLFPVFLLVPDVLGWIALVGGVTAALAATMGLVEVDIKKVLAYSTVSQLGYMFLALGVGAAAAGVFHLVTHAFFKACLFLGAGAVMHAMHDQTDMRKMGGLRHKIKWTWATMLVATLAITGVPGLAGFFSKDAILANAYHPPALAAAHGLAASDASDWRISLALGLGILTIGLTAFYMFRLYFMTFHGEPRDRQLHDQAHEAAPAMVWGALIPLAALSVVGGLLNVPAAFGGSERFSRFLDPVLRPESLPHTHLAAHHATLSQELIFSLACLAPAALGGVLAYLWYGRPSVAPAAWAARLPGVYRLLSRKWWVDEAYDALIIGPFLRASRFLRHWIDELLIDGLVTLVGLVTEVIGELLRGFQTGKLRDYAFYLAFGAATILVWTVW